MDLAWLWCVSVCFCAIAGITLLFKRSSTFPGKRLLVLKPDSIGDYILFRNFLAVLRQSEKYRGYEITLCGNSVYSEFAIHFDHESVDKFIWIDKKRIYHDLHYYIRLAYLLKQQYEVTIHAIRSREMIFDYLAKISSSFERIGYMGDTVNIPGLYKRITDRWYTRLISSGDDYYFEFSANKQFFETILGIRVSFARPFLEAERFRDVNLPGLPGHFVAVFPGAQLPFRRWSTSNFSAVVQHVRKKCNIGIVIIGSKADQSLACEIIIKSGIGVVDLTGQSGLIQLPGIISKACLLIANDTMAVHFGAALNIPTIVISQLNHYGRFVPYPPEIMDKMVCAIPDIYEKQEANTLIEKFKKGSDVDIDLVSVEQVTSAIDRLLL